MRILLINNYRRSADSKIGKYEVALKSCFSSSRIETLSYRELKVDAVLGVVDAYVLSGSSASVCRRDTISEYSSVIELIRRADAPILGICFGHQLIAYTFGAPIRTEKLVKDEQEIEILEPDEIFSCWKAGYKISMSEYHRDHVKRLPEGFILLARSETCEIEAIKHESRPIYGVQFHPERSGRDGWTVLKNFFHGVVRR